MNSPIVTASPHHRVRLSRVDPDDTGALKENDATARFLKLREQISKLQEVLYAEHQRSLLLVFQAMDTGGKDGVVKALCHGLNPAGVQVHTFKAPSQDELAHDFLWRAHQAAPAKGMIGVWNRSHYEDVLVVRVHKLVPKKIWKARYKQINAFEKILSENGTTVLKFMLHISKDEQKERLQARLDDTTKHWKFNVDDLKERALWDEYQDAYEDAINRCATKHAPWHVVPANHKWSRNLAVAEQVVDALKELDPQYPPATFDPTRVVIE